MVLDNWWPTPQTVQIRRGCAEYVALPGEDGYVQTLMTYNDGQNQKIFAATETAIWDITTPSAPVKAQSGLTGGVWNFTQFATTGGIFLIAVNGSDKMRLFDGTHWFPIGDQAIARLTISSTTTAFQGGETVTGGTSAATGTVLYADGGFMFVVKTSSATFASGETVTGSLGGHAVLSAAEETWWPALKAASTSSISSIQTSDFSFVWAYQARLYFIQKNGLNMWYLGADTVTGDATAFPMGGIFPDGGALMFGASWSLENSGQGGLSEQCVMVTDEGEVAIYQGYDPNLASSWSKVGQYRIDRPRGPRAFTRMGGDLLIATDTGMIPLAQAINKGVATLAPAAVSYPIEHDWDGYVSEREARTWQVAVWPENQMMAVALPRLDGYDDTFLVANVRTGKWARFTGWDGACLATHNGQLYFGTSGGRIVAAWQTGMDMGKPFTATFVPLFSDGGASEVAKWPKEARIMLRGTYDVIWRVSMQYDYVLSIPAVPDASVANGANLWDEAIWDDAAAVWSSSEQKTAQRLWTPVGGYGYALAPCLQITSGNVTPLDNELVRVDISILGGNLLS